MKSKHVVITVIVSVLMLSFTLNANEPAPSNPTEVIEQYLKMPIPQKGQHDQKHQDRHAILKQLKNYPDQTIGILEKILPTLKEPHHRAEITEYLRYFPTKQSADLACKMLKDTDDKVRGQAIQVLRMMARRTDRFGPQRKIRPRPLVKTDPAVKEKNIRQRLANKAKGKSTPPEKASPKLYDEFPPQVEGLVPVLIEAVNDTSHQNRITALYALADTRDSRAVAAIRKCLKDPDEKVRLQAACFLTEYNDKASLPELKKAITWLNKNQPTDHFDYYWTAAKVLASLERVTKESFGEIPMIPGLYSNSDQAVRSAALYDHLIKQWGNYFQNQETNPSKSKINNEEKYLKKTKLELDESQAFGYTHPWKSFMVSIDEKTSLPKLKMAIMILNNTKPSDQVDYYRVAGKVIPALERVTKISFGKIPMVPDLCSNTRQMKENAIIYQYLIKKWANYFQEQEKDSPIGDAH